MSKNNNQSEFLSNDNGSLNINLDSTFAENNDNKGQVISLSQDQLSDLSSLISEAQNNSNNGTQNLTLNAEQLSTLQILLRQASNVNTGAHNLATNMSNGTGAELFSAGLNDMGSAVEQFGVAGAGAINVATNTPGVLSQVNTATTVSTYAHLIAKSGWVIKSLASNHGGTIATIGVNGVNIITSAIALHPGIFFVVSLGVLVYLNRDPLVNVTTGTKDIVTGTVIGSVKATIAAAKLLGSPFAITKDLVEHAISSQHAVKSNGEHIEVDLSDVKLLTLEDIAKLIQDEVNDFTYLCEKSEEQKNILAELKSVSVNQEEPTTTEVKQNMEESLPTAGITEEWIAIEINPNADNISFTFMGKPNNAEAVDVDNNKTEYSAQGREIKVNEDDFVVMNTAESNDTPITDLPLEENNSPKIAVSEESNVIVEEFVATMIDNNDDNSNFQPVFPLTSDCKESFNVSSMGDFNNLQAIETGE